MSLSKKIIIATSLCLMLPVFGWAEAPVVDDSDNFALANERQAARAPVDSKYGEPEYGWKAENKARGKQYAMNNQADDEVPLAKDDGKYESRDNYQSSSHAPSSDNVSLIEKVQSLQKEVQELRGQLEVQAHELKLLQQQQIAFYKDLDARIGGAAPTAKKNTLAQPSTNLDAVSKGPDTTAIKPAAPKTIAEIKTSKTEPVVTIAPTTYRANPADEQIGYLAAYELVQSKQIDQAILAMQNFAQKYPKGGYTANAQYWLGELFMEKRDYPKAIEHFDVVLSEFPSSSKSAVSMLKSGFAFAATGDNEQAVKRLQQVVKTYPDTPTAELAKTKLESIRAV